MTLIEHEARVGLPRMWEVERAMDDCLERNRRKGRLRWEPRESGIPATTGMRRSNTRR